MMHIKTKALTLTLSKDQVSFELKSNLFTGVFLRSQLDIIYQSQGNKIHLLGEIGLIEHQLNEQRLTTPCGDLHGTTMSMRTRLQDVHAIVRIGLLPNDPAALIQLELQNQGCVPLLIDRLIPLIVNPGDLHLATINSPNPAFFSNGWQSWSSTGVYGSGDKQRSSILGPFQNPMVINPGTPQTKDRDHFSADMFGVLGDRNSRIGLLTGFLSQKSHFGSLETRFNPEPSIHMWANGDHAELPPGERTQTDWAVLSFINLDAPEPLEDYFKMVSAAHNIHSDAPVPVGWCSWYHFYENITQEDIENNLDSVVSLHPEIPLPLFQIDDGFETFPGDWFDFDPGFPNGLAPLAKKAESAGLIPGLWLAPFIVHPKANLVKEHPDWLLRNAHGKPVHAGFVWNALTYALDLTNPNALNYTCEVIRTAVRKWGFSYLKLDFLYAAALEGVYQDPTRTRAQVLRGALAALREAAGPEVTLLACGCPLGSALGLFEAMRISADVSGYWKPHFPPISPLLKNEPHMPAARNALQNILTRAPLHRQWWINDPDCLLLRPETKLTLAEVQTLATAIGLTGGSLLLSDDLPALPNDRLQIAQFLLPVLDQRAQVLDWFDSQMPAHLRVDLDGPSGEWHLLGIFNWDDKPASLEFSPETFRLVDSKTWWLREFWTGEIGKMGSDSPFICRDVPAHGVRVYAARSYQPGEPAYLGSDLHFSQGVEINDWQVSASGLTVQFNLGHKASGQVYLYLPWLPTGALFRNGVQVLQKEGCGIYSLYLDNVNGQTLQINN